MTMYLRRRASFSAGLSRLLPGDADRGHNYLCELTVGGAIDPDTGMVINIKDVDAVLKARVTGPLGGKLLDTEVAAFRDRPPTPENITRFLWDECREAFAPLAQTARVSLWPTPTLHVSLSALENPNEAPMLTVTRTYDFPPRIAFIPAPCPMPRTRRFSASATGKTDMGIIMRWK